MPGRHAAPPAPMMLPLLGPVRPATTGQLARRGLTAVLVTAAGAVVTSSTGAFGMVPAADLSVPNIAKGGETDGLSVPAVHSAPATAARAAPGTAPVSTATRPGLASVVQGPSVVPVPGPAPSATAVPKTVAASPSTVAPAAASVARSRLAGETATTSAASAGGAVGSGTSIGSRIVTEAAKYRGVPYVWGATGPSSFDCSGYTSYVFKKMGISLPRTAQQQYDAAQHLSRSQAQPGDLIFDGSPGSIYHVAIYAGNGKIWTAPQPGESVKLGNLWGDWSVGRIRS